MQRFLGGDRDGASIEKDRKKREQAQVSALEAMMLADPEYEALYNEVSGQLRQAEIATDKDLLAAEQDLNVLLENAARLSDGRAVFRDKNGDIVTQYGESVDKDLVAEIQWPTEAPTYQDFLDQRESIDALRRYQVGVLGGARDRLSDEDNPLDKDELEQMQKDIQSGLDKTAVKEIEATPSPKQGYESTADIDLPKLGG